MRALQDCSLQALRRPDETNSEFLARAKKEHRKGACNRTCCRTCGWMLLREDVAKNWGAVTLLRGTVRAWILRYPVVKRHSSSSGKIVTFIKKAARLCTQLHQLSDHAGPIFGGAVATHYNFVAKNCRVIRAHIHVWVFIDPNSASAVTHMLTALADSHDAELRPSTNGDGTSLRHVAQYLLGSPLQVTRDERGYRNDFADAAVVERRGARRDWHHAVFQYAEMELRGPAVFGKRFGIADGRCYRAVQEGILKKHLGVDDPLPAHRSELVICHPALKVVLEEACRANGCRGRHFDLRRHGRDRNGQQRYRCRKCKRTTIHPFKFDKCRRPVPNTRQSRQIVRNIQSLYKAHVSKRQIAKTVGLSYPTVAKILGER